MSKISRARILPGGSFYFTKGEAVEKKEIETNLVSPPPSIEKSLKKPEIINIESDKLNDISFIVLASSKKLNSERILKAGQGIIFNDLGENNDLIISLNPGLIPNLVTVTSKGTGINLNLPLSGNEINLRSLQGSGHIDIYNLGNNVIVSAPKATIETSSLGGISIGLTVSAGTGNRNELLIRGLVGGGIIEVSALTNTIVISAPTPPTQNVTVSSFGTGSQVAIGVSANREIHFRTFVGGGIVEVNQLTNTIVISAPTPPTQNVTVSSFGGGSQVVIGVSANREIHFRTLIAGGGIELSSTSNTIILSSTGALKDRIQGDILANYITTSALNSSIHMATNGNVVLAINSAGFVGINTLDPEFHIDIFSSGDSFIGPAIRFKNNETVSDGTSGVIIGLITDTPRLEISNYHTDTDGSSKTLFNFSNGTKLSLDKNYFQFNDTSFINYDTVSYKKALLKTIIPGGINGVKHSFYLDNSAELVMPESTIWSFEIDILAIEKTNPLNVYASYKIKGVSVRNDLPTTITAIPALEEIIYESTSAEGWDCGVSANKANGSIEIYAKLSSYTGTADISWAAHIRIIELIPDITS